MSDTVSRGCCRPARVLPVAGALAALLVAGDSLSGSSAGPAPADPPLYKPVVIPRSLEQDFARKKFTRDPRSGNYLGANVSSKTFNEARSRRPPTPRRSSAAR